MELNRSIRSIGAKSEWTSWFAAILLCSLGTFYLFAFTEDPASAGSLVLLVIGCLFGGALVKSYRDISFLDRETRVATQQVSQLQEVNDVTVFLQNARPSIFRSHIQALNTIFLSHSKISQDTILEIAHARLVARNRVVELLASILITLGLIGTILGLLIAVGGLGGVLQSDGQADDMSDLIAHMKTTVDGLGTAFYTTLVGAVAGGVVLRILTSVVEAHIMRYIAHLAELAEIHVLPAMRRTAAQLEAQGYYKQL